MSLRILRRWSTPDIDALTISLSIYWVLLLPIVCSQRSRVSMYKGLLTHSLLCSKFVELTLNNSLFSVNYPRVIQFKYMIKNNTSDTLFVPINVVNGYNTFHSRIKMGIGTHYFNNLLDQKLTMGKNDVILAPNGQTSVTITLYSQDIESLHLKKIVFLENILRKVSFRYFYSNSDVSHYSPIELIFHNSNETDWIDIKNIQKEREKQWSVYYL